MSRVTKVMLIGCVLLAAGRPAAGGQTALPVPATVVVPPADPATRALLRTAGPRALVNVVVWPDGWKDAATDNRIALAKALSLLIERPVDGERFSSAPDALGGLLAVLGAKPGSTTSKPGQWPGWDSSRPLVAALFEAQAGYLELARDAFDSRDVGGDDGPRHRVLVPASDPPGLAKALGHNLPALDGRFQMTPALRRLLRGGTIHPVGERGLLVAVVPERDRVRLELFVEDVGKARAVARWLRPVEASGPGGELVETPAVRFVMSARGNLGAIYVRSWLFRSTLASLQAFRLARYLQRTHPEERGVLFAMALSGVLKARVLTADQGAEMDDVAVAISSGAPLRIKQVASLTRRGASVYCAALGGADGRGCRWFDDTTRIDAAAVAASVVKPPAYELLGDKFAGWFSACGDHCTLGLGVRQVLGMLVGLQGLLGRDPLPVIAKHFDPGLFFDIVPGSATLGSKQTLSGLCGRALVSESVVGASAGGTAMFSPVARYAEMDWEEPGAGAGGAQAASCLLRVLVEVAEGLERAAYAGPGRNLSVLSDLRAAQQGNLACAAADPACGREAEGILELLGLLYEDIEKHAPRR